MEVIKVIYNEEIRRISLKSLINNGIIDDITFINLSDKIKEIYPSLGKSFKLTWIDDESDVIAVTTTSELKEALTCMRSLGLNSYKFNIYQIDTTSIPAKEATTAASNVVHRHITCDECGASPIKGIRYKCTVRDDFDLCETCESSKTQPYPMIKIYTPEQSPLAILVAVRDGPNRVHPHHGGPGGPHHAGPGGPHHAGPGGSCGADGSKFEGHPHRGPRGRYHRFDSHCGRWARNAAKAFVSAVEAVVEPIEKELLKKSDTEQKFIDEAIRLSTAESVSKEETTSPKSAPVATAKPASVPTQIPRLKGRYIRDITIPDGTCLAPNSQFEKIWWIRNDGVVDWQEGTQLVTAGGDYLCDPNVKAPVPILKAGEEGDVAITLVAPGVEGRFTSYFRLQSPDGETFGQRLWSDIVVIEEDIGWTVVNNKESIESSDMKVELPTPVVKVSEDIASSTVSITSSTADLISDNSSANSIHVSNNWGEAIENDIIEDNHIETTSFTQEELAWSTELSLLQDIGFTDKNACIELLVKHAKQPSGGAQPDPVAMQRVVMELLGQSISGY